MSKLLEVGKTYQLESNGVAMMTAILGAKFKHADGTFTVSKIEDGKAYTDDVVYAAGHSVFFPADILEGNYSNHKVTLVEETEA